MQKRIPTEHEFEHQVLGVFYPSRPIFAAQTGERASAEGLMSTPAYNEEWFALRICRRLQVRLMIPCLEAIMHETKTQAQIPG